MTDDTPVTRAEFNALKANMIALHEEFRNLIGLVKESRELEKETRVTMQSFVEQYIHRIEALFADLTSKLRGGEPDEQPPTPPHIN